MAAVVQRSAKAVIPGFFHSRISSTVAGDVAVISTTGLFRQGITGRGFNFTASGPAGYTVNVFFTHDNETLAIQMTPEAQAAVHWVPVLTLNAATPLLAAPDGITATAVKLVFSHAGSVASITCL